RRRLRVQLRAPGGGRAPGRSFPGDRERRRRRRVGLLVRRRPPAGRAAQRGGEPGARLLRGRRTAHPDRRQPAARTARAGPGLAARFERLAERAAESVRAEGVPRQEIETRRRIAHLRFSGQDSVVEVPYVTGRLLRPVFEERYTALFGHRPEGRPIELESVRVIASSRPPAPVPAGASAATPAGALVETPP